MLCQDLIAIELVKIWFQMISKGTLIQVLSLYGTETYIKVNSGPYIEILGICFRSRLWNLEIPFSMPYFPSLFYHDHLSI